MIALVSDLHSNLEATRVVFEKIGELGCERIYGLGDLVGYSCHPNEVVDFCRKCGVEGVRGNHDESVLSQDVTGMNDMAASAAFWTSKKLSSPSREFLRSLPLTREIEMKEKKCLLVHGSPLRPLDEYVYPDCPDSHYLRLIGGYDMLMLGHTHVPFVRTMGKKTIFNPGSVGQPRDGDPRASFSVFDGKKIENFRLEYNIKEEARAMSDARLPLFLAERLYSGV